MTERKQNDRDGGFTLIELLIVIGILAILATVVIAILNPAQMTKEARDSTRFSDFETINKAINIYQAAGQTDLGNTVTVYISLPAIIPANTNCSDYTLPALPAGYSYHCSPSASYRNIDSTGWIPINFNLVSYGSPLANLPVDPVNTVTNKNYYTYIPGGSYHIATILEADKYKMGGSQDRASTDKGSYPDLYESGTNRTLLPVDYADSSLVGYWKFDEGTGSTAYDASGGGHNGTWYGSGTYYTSGKVGSYAGQFVAGNSNYVNIPDSDSLDFNTRDFSISFWFNASYTSSRMPLSKRYGSIGNGYQIVEDTQLKFQIGTFDATMSSVGISSVFDNNWYFITYVADRDNLLLAYLNGLQSSSATAANTTSINLNNSYPLKFGDLMGGSFFTGLIDDIRIYNRALSAAEIQAIYNATK